MKFHLPASLLSALLAAAPAVHAATSDIPAGHTTVQVLTDETTWTLPAEYYGTKTAFVLNKDLTILAPVSNAPEAYGYYANGDYIFTSADEDKKYGLKFDFLSGTGGNRLAKHSNLRFEDLKTLTLSYYNSATPTEKRVTGIMAAFYYDQNGKALTINNVDNVTFQSIYVHTAGGVEIRGGLISTYNANSKVEFTNNGTISFANLQVCNTGSGSGTTSKPYVVGWVAGGVMHSGGDVSFADNDAVSFTDITTAVGKDCEDSAEHNAYGGAIAAYQGDVNFSGNKDVTFSRSVANSADARAYGGAISLFSNTSRIIGSTLSISENGNVTFQGNYADGRNGDNYSRAMSYGGAIAAGTRDIINIVNNTGTVRFDGNHAEYMGGAIYAARTGGTTAAGLPPAKINIAGNSKVYFTNNYVARRYYEAYYAADIYGGAIYAESLVTIANNEYVEFSGNYLQNKSGKKQGAAIYMAGSDASASLVIEGNKQVIFKKNYTLTSYSTTGAYYSFGSIYGENTQAKNVFSAKTGGSIQFHDAMYLMGDLAINSDYLDNSGVSQSAGGVVLFTGAYVAGYKEDTVFKHHTYSGDSYTSTLGGDVTVHGGTLQVHGSAKVNIGGGLSVAGSVDNVANVKVGTGTLNVGSLTSTTAGSADINLNAYGAMSLTGTAKVTAGQVTLTGGTLTMTDTAALTANVGGMTVQGVDDMAAKVGMTGGTLNIGTQKLTLGAGAEMNVSSNAVVTAGQVTLDGATLGMSGTAKLTATAGDLTASNAAGITMTGGALSIGSKELTLDTGAEMNLSGSAAVTAGQVTLTDATLKMQGGTLTATGGDLVVTKTSALADEGAAEKTYDVSVTGGTLDIGGQTLDLGSGTSMELSGGQVIAGQVKLDAATLEMAGTAKLTATSGDLSVLNAGGISMTGGALDIGSNKLELGTGAEMDMSGGQVTAGQVALTGAKLTIGGEAQVDASGGVDAQNAELVLQGGRLNAGTLELVDATLQMDAGVIDVSTGGVSLSDSASLVLNGGSLNVGENDIELGADMKLSLGESALVSAGKITVNESATFSVSAASSGKTAAPLAQTLTPVDNMEPTLKGAMLSADLELMGGSTYDATGGSVSLDGHELTLSTSDASKINLVLTLDSLSDPDAQIIIFSDVAMANFLFNVDGAPVVAGEDGNVSVSASNYFDNDWKDDYYINFDKAAGLVYLSSGLPSAPSEPAVPEPSSTALGLMALAGLAMRRRRK